MHILTNSNDTQPAKIPVNEFGNVDVRNAVPEGFVHVPGMRLTITCRRLGIEHAPALVGFEEYRRGCFSPQFDGVVVFANDAPKLKEAIDVLKGKRIRKAGKAHAVRQAELEQLRARYPDWRDALGDAAESMHRLNRLAYGDRERGPTIYAAKNRLVELLYREGLCERVEIHLQEQAGKRCYACGANGDLDGEDDFDIVGPCTRCEGTGWYLPPRTVRLYAFYFSIGGRSYAWHQPADLVTWPVEVTTEPRPMPALPAVREHGLESPVAVENAMEVVRVVLEGAATEARREAVGA
jgi:hypothetical protein